jgi:hypothetical protein
MPHLPENFRAAIEKGVRNIKGKLCPLNPVEKRQLLADLRERGDCPDGWKNRKNMAPKKQQSILESLHSAIYRLVNPEKARAISARNHKKKNREWKSKSNQRQKRQKKKREWKTRRIQCQSQRQKIKGNSRSQCTGHFGKQRPSRGPLA